MSNEIPKGDEKMCTAITFKTNNHYFGRTLDLEYTYNEAVTVTPRNFSFKFRKKEAIRNHYAIIGMATVSNAYPLYYEAANECGLAIAGLNFPHNAHYNPELQDKDNIAPFELIPWILSQCKNISEARSLLGRINICHINFSESLPASPLHWIVADKNASITIESVVDGLKIYENPVGVLTNNPCFDYHMIHLCDFLNLTALPPENHFGGIDLQPYSKGMGAIGLPGDLSSASRFVRAVFTKLNSVSGESEGESISQFFHILGSVAQSRGCTKTNDSQFEITQYTSCINTDKGIYYYSTYENNCISAVNMHHCNLDTDSLFCYPLITEQMINRQN